MRADFLDLDVPATAATDGDDLDVRLYRDKWVQVWGTFTASLNIEISLNGGADFIVLHTGITTPGLYEIAPTCTHVLVRTVTHSAGTPHATLAGLNTRSD